MPIKSPAIDRFWSHVVKTSNGCWKWTAAIKSNGYGAFGGDNKNGYAHRFSYETYVGPIPQGKELDHLCRNRWCVNPTHLEAVTRQINMLRGNTFAARNASKTHCKNGHEFTKENTYLHLERMRKCRRCHADVETRRRVRIKEETRTC